MRKLKIGSIWHHPVRNLSSSHVLLKRIKDFIAHSSTLPVFFMGEPLTEMSTGGISWGVKAAGA